MNRKEYLKEWYKKHPEKIKEYNQKQKEYKKEWEIKNKEKRLIQHRMYDKKRYPHKKIYNAKWINKHPEKVKEYYQKYKEYQLQWNRISPKSKERRRKYFKSEKGIKLRKEFDKTVKGKVRLFKSAEEKKFKGTPLYPNFKSQVTIELVEMVDARDTHCVYCGKELVKQIKRNRDTIEYDHIDPYKPFSETNMVRACGACNISKSNSDVLKWCKFKGYTPAPIVLELLSKQKSG